jgi:Cysteine-rich secretory protein family
MMLPRTTFAGCLLLLAPLALHAQPSATVSTEVRQLFTLTNQDRAAQGLGPLAWSPELARAAALHDREMVGRNDLQHQFAGEPDLAGRAGEAGAHFSAVAENIAIGPSAAALEGEWMHSAKHRENILDPRMNAVGIALVRRGAELWAVADFAQAVESLAPAATERRVVQLLANQGLRDAKPSQDARQTCALEHGSAGATHPAFIMRWEGSDLSRLPDVLVEKLRSGRYRAAAVGVCDSARPSQGFTSYRVAVLLY